MAELEALFTRYDQLVVFDTETTGLYPNRDEIIEFSAAVLERKDGRAEVTREYDNLVALSPGRFVPPKIQALTGITNQDLRERGIPIWCLLPLSTGLKNLHLWLDCRR